MAPSFGTRTACQEGREERAPTSASASRTKLRSVMFGKTSMVMIEVCIPLAAIGGDSSASGASIKVDESLSPAEVVFANSPPGSVSNSAAVDATETASSDDGTGWATPHVKREQTTRSTMVAFLRKHCTVENKLVFISEQEVNRGRVKYLKYHLSCDKQDADLYVLELHNFGFGTLSGVGFINVYPVSYQGVGKQTEASQNSRGQSLSLSYNRMSRADNSTASSASSGSFFDPAPIDTAMGKQDAKKKHENAFVASITEKITLYEAFQIAESRAHLTFDYTMFVFLASWLAFVGLITNNTVVVVASMLVSPLMGPILAFTFGSYVSVHRLVRVGLITESISLILGVAVGFVGGLCSIPVVGDTLPTLEMMSRGEGYTAILTGIAIAIPSGIGIALSILGDSASSLVGVAISASLLPPAVNTGIFFAMGVYSDTSYIDYASVERMYKEAYPYGYFANSTFDAACMMEMGIWSLLLTFVNIVCIWITGVMMFKIKEVSSLGDEIVSNEERQMIKDAQDMLQNKTVPDATRTISQTKVPNCAPKLDMDLFQEHPTLGLTIGRRMGRARKTSVADELFPDVCRLRQQHESRMLTAALFQPPNEDIGEDIAEEEEEKEKSLKKKRGGGVETDEERERERERSQSKIPCDVSAKQTRRCRRTKRRTVTINAVNYTSIICRRSRERWSPKKHCQCTDTINQHTIWVLQTKPT